MAFFTVQPTILKLKTPLEFSEMHKKVVQFFSKYHIG